MEAFFKLPLPEVERGSFDHETGQISYVRAGNPAATPIVFVHGSPRSWEDWKLIISRARLKERFNLIAVNRPGWDDKKSSAEVVPELSSQSAMLRKALDLGVKGAQVILVGHSLGGPIVLQIAVDYPDRVAAVVLLAPSLDPDLDAVLWYNRMADYQVVKFFLPEMLAKSNDEIMALPPSLRSLAKDLASIDQPVVMVQGEKDRLVHPGNAAYAKKKLINARYHEVLLPNFGHLIPHLRPAEVVLAIEQAAKMTGQSSPSMKAASLRTQTRIER